MKKIVLFGAFLALTVVSLGKEVLPAPVNVPEVKGVSMSKGQSFSAAFGMGPGASSLAGNASETPGATGRAVAAIATTIGTTTASNGVNPPFTPYGR